MRSKKKIVFKARTGRKGGRRKGVPSKPGEAYTVLIKCNMPGCPKSRWVLPSDAHHVTRCITCQQDFVKESRRQRSADRRKIQRQETNTPDSSVRMSQ